MNNCKVMPLNYLQKNPTVPKSVQLLNTVYRHYLGTILISLPAIHRQKKLNSQNKKEAKLALITKWDTLSKDTLTD